jgi:hypothetical protein
VPTRVLGRLPHDPDRPVLRLSRYLTRQVPAHPVFADYLAQVPDWDVYGNDRFGTCGPAAVANQRKQVTHFLTQQEVSPTLDEVFDLYRRSGNPGFDQRTGVGDNGVVMADMLSALLSGGIGGAKPLAYAAVDVTNPDEVRAAVALFGSVLIGVDLDVAQETQTDEGLAWDYVRRSAEWGGHALLVGAYTSQTGRGIVDLSGISWGERVGMTDEFCGRQLQEAWVVVWPEMLGTTEFEQGVDLSALAADYEALTGRPFPSLPAPEPEPMPLPTPAPTPSPVPTPDEQFRAELSAFVASAQAWLGGTQEGQ